MKRVKEAFAIAYNGFIETFGFCKGVTILIVSILMLAALMVVFFKYIVISVFLLFLLCLFISFFI